MFQKIIAFFMSIISFIAGLFGINFSSDNINKFENLSYGTHERQVLDLYLPSKATGEIGLVLYIHGGGWTSGDKSAYTDAAQDLAKDEGVAAATMNYRYLSADVTMNDILDDIEAAVKCIKEKAKENGVTINVMMTTGHSAGGHLSMLYAYARKDVSAITPVAVANYAGPTDLLDQNYFTSSDIGVAGVETLLSWAIGETVTQATVNNYAEQLKKCSPLYYVNSNTVPTIINHGQKDTTVPYSNAQSLVDAFEAAGATYVFNSYPNSSHILIEDSENVNKANELFISYITEYLK